MIDPWPRLQSEIAHEYTVFRVRRDECRSPLTDDQHTFYVIEAPDWVNVIPVTPEGQLVFVRQYRHGTGAVSLEIPGGIIDPEDASPARAARRELVEETGYDTGTLLHLGTVAPNPALQNNRCHCYLALNARPTHAPALDQTEDIETTLVDPDEVPGLILSGQVSHALVVAAFYLFAQYRRDPEGFSSEPAT